MAILPIKDAPQEDAPVVYKKGDSRIGRIKDVKTDRGTFRFLEPRKEK
jgi:hypothetical protein